MGALGLTISGLARGFVGVGFYASANCCRHVCLYESLRNTRMRKLGAPEGSILTACSPIANHEPSTRVTKSVQGLVAMLPHLVFNSKP